MKDRPGSLCLLPLTGLELHPKQQKQIHPQRTHEMPVPRRGNQSTSSQHRPMQFPDYPDQTTKSAEHMQRMRYGKHVKEGVAHVGGHSESLRLQLQPGIDLSGDEKQAQTQRDVQPERGTCRLVFLFLTLSLSRRP